MEKMNILATVYYGNLPITQHWEIRDGDPEVYIIVNELENEDILAIQLDNRFIREVEGVKCYLGTLNVADSVVVTNI
jgi:hypothetical protein